jgi:alpha-mannosidase
MRQSGISRFLTQKLSWNAFNKPIYHTFLWQGIDGSEVLTHFPPTDTYNADCEVKQLRSGAREYKENDRSRHSLMLFGYGDGGGGPTEAHARDPQARRRPPGHSAHEDPEQR